jgi:hypothetical protein
MTMRRSLAVVAFFILALPIHAQDTTVAERGNVGRVLAGALLGLVGGAAIGAFVIAPCPHGNAGSDGPPCGLGQSLMAVTGAIVGFGAGAAVGATVFARHQRRAPNSSSSGPHAEVLRQRVSVAQPCSVADSSRLKRDWDPLTLAGQFRVEWIVEAGTKSRTDSLRLFLWKTSMRDSSIRQRKSPAPGDTLAHPLYGVMVRDSGEFNGERIEQLRRAIDPVYPPVLLTARIGNHDQSGDRFWTVLEIDTSDNRRDGVIVTDGVGIGAYVREANQREFRGTFGPWGIVETDRGHYCARRVTE